MLYIFQSDPVAAAQAGQQLSSEAFDAIAKTDQVGLLDKEFAARLTAAQRIGELAPPAKIVALVTEILDGKTPLKHITYANSSMRALGFSAVTNKATPGAVDSLYRVLQRAMFEHVAQLDLPNEQNPRLRLLTNGVLPTIDTMVNGGVVPTALLGDLKKLNADPTVTPDIRAKISKLAGVAALQAK